MPQTQHHLRLQQIIEYLTEYQCRRIDDDRLAFMREEWHAAAKIYDRFFFILFMLLMMTMTVKFLVPVSGDGFDF